MIHTSRGFTLIETLVAISILLVSLAGPLAIASQSLSVAQYAREQIVAFYLAQEGVEYVRTVRDENLLPGGGGDWLAGLRNCTNGCEVDFKNFNHSPCGNECDPLTETALGYYDHSGSGTVSPYTRKVTIQPVTLNSPNDAAIVTVELSWSNGVQNRQFEIRTMLFEWI